MKKGISTAVLLSALLLLTLAAVFLLQCFLGGMLFDWNYREPLLFLACLFAGNCWNSGKGRSFSCAASPCLHPQS